MNQKELFLSTCEVSWMGSLKQEQLETMYEQGEVFTLSAGETLIQQGDPQDTLYLILEGKVQVSISNDKLERDFIRLRKGDSIGEMTLLDQQSATATVTTLKETTLWKIPHAEVLEFWRSKPKMAAAIFAGLFTLATRRLKDLNPILITLMSDTDNADQSEADRKFVAETIIRVSPN